jgi:hypothetical protein
MTQMLGLPTLYPVAATKDFIDLGSITSGGLFYHLENDQNHKFKCRIVLQ